MVPYLVLALAGCSGATEPTTDTDTSEPTDTDETSETGDTGPTPTTPPDPCTVPTLVVGTGTEAYEPLSDGDPLTLVFGPQGGWHVDVGAHILGTEQVVTVEARLSYTTEDRTLTEVIPPQALALVPAEPCGWTIFGVRAILDDAALKGDPAAFVCALDGEPAVLHLTLVDLANEVELTDHVEVTLQQDPEQDCT